MLDRKNSFIVYYDYYDQMKALTDEQVGKVFRSMFCCEMDKPKKEYPKLDAMSQMAFNFIETNLRIDRDKYNEKCKKNKQSADKRWGNDANESERNQTHTTDADNDIDSGIVTDTVSVNGSGTVKDTDNVSGVVNGTVSGMGIDIDRESDSDNDIGSGSARGRGQTSSMYDTPTLEQAQKFIDDKNLTNISAIELIERHSKLETKQSWMMYAQTLNVGKSNKHR